MDAADALLVAGLKREDLRAVAVVTPQNVPMVFRRPIIAVVERPLLAPKVGGFIVAEDISEEDGRVLARYVVDAIGDPERREPPEKE